VTSGRITAGPLTVTVTPGSTPPDASVTLPKISPVSICAESGAAHSANDAAITSSFIRRFK
jgi:hypothetical protein